MSPIKFFTPISFEWNGPLSFKQKMIQTVDSYFYLGGKKAYVIDSDGKKDVHLLFAKRSLFTTALKVVSYFIFALPLIALAAKWLLRKSYDLPQLDLKVGISPLATETLGFDLDKVKLLEPNDKITFPNPKIAFDKEQTMRKIIDNVIAEINNTFTWAIQTNPNNSNRFIVQTWKHPAAEGINDRRYLSFYKDITTDGKRVLLEPSLLDVVLSALQERRYLNVGSINPMGVAITILNRQ